MMNWNYNSLICLFVVGLTLLAYATFYDSIYYGRFSSAISGEIAQGDTDRFDYTPDENLPNVPEEVEQERRRVFVPYEEEHQKYLEETRLPNINIHHDYLMHDHPLQEEPLQEEPIP